MLADTPLVGNLDNPGYMKVLLDGRTNLEELFADLGSEHLSRAQGLRPDADRMLPGFRSNEAANPSRPGSSVAQQIWQDDEIQLNIVTIGKKQGMRPPTPRRAPALSFVVCNYDMISMHPPIS